MSARSLAIRRPWSAFPEGRTTRVGLRGLARYTDAGMSGIRGVLATGSGDASQPARMDPVPTEPVQAITEGLLEPKGLLTTAPKFDLVADVAGDGMKERVTAYDQFLVVCGPHYRAGREYFFRDLDADIVSLDVRSVTGRSNEKPSKKPRSENPVDKSQRAISCARKYRLVCVSRKELNVPSDPCS